MRMKHRSRKEKNIMSDETMVMPVAPAYGGGYGNAGGFGYGGDW